MQCQTNVDDPSPATTFTSIIFPFIHFNTYHTYPTEGGSNTDSTWVNHSLGSLQKPMENALDVPPKTQFGRNPCFAQISSVEGNPNASPKNTAWIVTNFTINLLYNSSTGVSRGITCDGDWSYVSKTPGQVAWQQQQGTYQRYNDFGSQNMLNRIVFGSFIPYTHSDGRVRGVTYADLNLELVPIPTFTTQTTSS
jgi:hypothetical protein